MANLNNTAAAANFKAKAAPVATALLAVINNAGGIDCEAYDSLQAQLSALYTPARKAMVGEIVYHVGFGTRAAQ